MSQPASSSPQRPAGGGLGALALRLLTDPRVAAQLGQGRRTYIVGWLMVANGASQLLGVDLGLAGLGDAALGEPTFDNPTMGGGGDPISQILTGLGLLALRSSIPAAAPAAPIASDSGSDAPIHPSVSKP